MVFFVDEPSTGDLAIYRPTTRRDLTLIQALAAGARTDADGFPILDAVAETALSLAGLAVALPLVLLTVLIIQRRPAGTVSSVVGHIRWRWLGTCMLVALGFAIGLIGLDVALTAALGGTSRLSLFADWPAFLATAAMLLALVPW